MERTYAFNIEILPLCNIAEMSCWMVTGERQATRIRGLYLKTILRQDIAFLTLKQQQEKSLEECLEILFSFKMHWVKRSWRKCYCKLNNVGKFIQFMSTFVGGFIVAFFKGWLLSIVLMSCIPALVIAGGAMALIMSKMSSRGQVAYAQAGNVVEQTIGAIRTVSAFTGEKLAIDKYDSKLKIACASTVQQGLVSGVGLGTVSLIVFSTYGLAVWYGSKLIIERGYNGGDVINVIMAIMTGGMLQHTKCLRQSIRNADLIAVVNAGKLIEKGTHTELIQDPNGAYSQLVRMQGGNREEENMKNMDLEKVDLTTDLDNNLSRSSSQRLSAMRRSTSQGSSRHSFTLNYTVPGLIGIHEAEIGDEDKQKEDKGSLKKRKNVSIRRLAGLNKPELPYLLLGSLAAIIHGFIFPLFGLLLSTAIKIFFYPPQKLRSESRFWALMYFGLGVVTLLVVPFQNYLFGVAGGKLIERIRSLTFKKVVHQEISWFDDPAHSSGAIGARLSTDASTVRTIMGDALALIVQNIATVVAGLVIAFTANWILALIILLVMPLIGVQGFLQTKMYKGFSADAKVMYEEASQIANDAVGSIRTVASFCAEEKVMDMYQKKCEGPMKQGVKIGIVSGASLGFGSFILYCTNAFCFYIGSVLIQHGLASFGQVFKVFFALTLSAVGVTQSTGMAPDASKAKDSIASIFDILDRKPEIDSSSDVGTTLATVHGVIEFKHVSYRYATSPDVQIFKDLCLTIPSGKTVALVGESGSGKSTVISLIERFYNPESGSIYLDGVEIRQFKLSWLRQQMGLVSQEPVLFNETIRDNIAYSRQGHATEEEIIEAAKSANAHNFISSLPQGYDTSVGERGIQLSGGQKQRIAIARAILKDPKILLLDEATSALDAESERIVQEALDRVMVNRTTVVVAHRLTTIKGADVIAVVKNGVIAEEGRHDALMNIKDGVYASLVALHMTSA
ncbi:hypothetical protein H5410_007449 [Solanum commersonii]|uniref:ABC transporter B family member 9 n=1 Tax=Solanum commersonii TaxID=4109 RepID=A0A9J6AE44_SOLCO|nr:hypothetical protein H5410_007449 [Solanum commersonii]